MRLNKVAKSSCQSIQDIYGQKINEENVLGNDRTSYIQHFSDKRPSGDI